MNVVLDTNVLVSALWSPGRQASDIFQAAISGRFICCYDYRILEEYERVLHYPRFDFSEWEIRAILEPLIHGGLSVVPDPIIDVSFERDETDRKFYEVAKYCQATLITGNLKHYPADPDILPITDFIQRYM